MKAKIITLDPINSTAAAVCYESSQKFNGDDLQIKKFQAITPDKVEQQLTKYKMVWSWPWREERIDVATGLTLHPYVTKDPKKRVACFLSHYELWQEVVETNEPMIILEDDAIFVERLPFEKLQNTKFSVVGLNNPLGATRKSGVFHDIVQKGKREGWNIIPCPSVDAAQVPQGLAGNSAYYMTPRGAKKLIDLAHEHGCWPNDALMCGQLMPGMLGVTTTYYTRVQGNQSQTKL